MLSDGGMPSFQCEVMLSNEHQSIRAGKSSSRKKSQRLGEAAAIFKRP
jgi:hypothetical protein